MFNAETSTFLFIYYAFGPKTLNTTATTSQGYNVRHGRQSSPAPNVQGDTVRPFGLLDHTGHIGQG